MLDVVSVVAVVVRVIRGCGDVVAAGHTHPLTGLRVLPNHLLQVLPNAEQVFGEPLHIPHRARSSRYPVKSLRVWGLPGLGTLRIMMPGYVEAFRWNASPRLYTSGGIRP
jgi:hypothetical protein